MNNQRRSDLRSAITYLDKAISIISDVMFKERLAIENVPENRQETERFSKMEDSMDLMGDAMDNVKEARSTLCEAVEN